MSDLGVSLESCDSATPFRSDSCGSMVFSQRSSGLEVRNSPAISLDRSLSLETSPEESK